MMSDKDNWDQLDYMRADIAAERKRGDSYRRRALALTRRGRDCSRAVNYGINVIERAGAELAAERQAREAAEVRAAGLAKLLEAWEQYNSGRWKGVGSPLNFLLDKTRAALSQPDGAALADAGETK